MQALKRAGSRDPSATRDGGRAPPAPAGPEDEALRRRWHEAAEGGGTRRDQVLKILEESREGPAPVPAEPLDLRGVSLINADLQRLDLSHADLSGADLSGADLSGSILFGTCLRGALLHRARLEGTELTGADLAEANLNEARAARAGLGGASLRHARLFGAELSGATLSHADLSGADLRQATLVEARLLETDLCDADLSGGNLQRAQLDGAKIGGAVLDGADLRGTRLRGLQGYAKASWLGTDIREIDFTGAWLLRRFILDQNYLHEFRSRDRWSEVVYFIWWLTSDCGRSLGRWSLLTLALILGFSGLYAGVALDYGDHHTFLSPLYFSVVTFTTLGYGDVLPASPVAQVVAMLEVSTGYVMLGGLITIFSAKFGRRAE